MQRLPKAVVLSHRRWPLPLNYILIGTITAYVTIFIRTAYYVRGADPAAVLMEFVIAALAYIFGLVLILRQFAGVYPEYIVTTGRTGLSLRKTVYRNIIDVEEISRNRAETTLLVVTNHGMAVRLTLPTRSVPVFYDQLKPEL